VVVIPIQGGTREQVSDADVAHDSPGWSPDGRMLAFVRYDEQPEIVVATLGMSGERPLGPDLPAGLRPRRLDRSPDGSRIAFDAETGGFSHIYVIGADGTGLAQLTSGLANDRSPAWSPDGSKLALASDRDGNFEIYVMDADGSNPTRLTNEPSFDSDPAWRP
jgi:Tol biopolymer transport system component